MSHYGIAFSNEYSNNLLGLASPVTCCNSQCNISVVVKCPVWITVTWLGVLVAGLDSSLKFAFHSKDFRSQCLSYCCEFVAGFYLDS